MTVRGWGLYRGALPAKRKVSEYRVLGSLYTLPRFPIAPQPGMAVIFPGYPSHLALSIDGGPRTIMPVLYVDCSDA